jgi:hypothetical protein
MYGKMAAVSRFLMGNLDKGFILNSSPSYNMLGRPWPVKPEGSNNFSLEF